MWAERARVSVLKGTSSGYLSSNNNQSTPNPFNFYHHNLGLTDVEVTIVQYFNYRYCNREEMFYVYFSIKIFCFQSRV